MYLISTAEGEAVGTRNGITFAGQWVWRWKDWIDRRFMRRFNDLPEMATATAAASAYALADKQAIKEISAIAMRCGGCGAKVGATVLSRALGNLEPAPRKEVLVGLDAPDDAAVVDTGGPRLAVHTVDYFRWHRRRPLSVRQDRGEPRARRYFRHGRRAAIGARHRHRSLWPGSQGRGRSQRDDDRRQRDAARGGLRPCRRTHLGRRGTGARLLRERARRARALPAQRRDAAGRRADPDQAHRHWNAARRLHARQSEGPVGNGGARRI